jgi:N-acyl-D-aspartate/D-glutamate deacylase
MGYDRIIRNGTVVDGTGVERRTADVAIKDGRVAAIGALSASDAAEVVDADGLIVAPGFVDCHTHYDAQLFWDPLASPSSNHGVTTVVSGLCGFTLQPLGPGAADYLVPMLSKVEDIPISALQAGVPLSWKSFAEFRAGLEGRLGINAAFATGHSALRRVVMGERAKGGRATREDLEKMKALLRACLSEGAIGFSTSNSTTHNDHLGEPVPSRFADHDEFVALAQVCRDFEGAQVEIQPGILWDEETSQLLTDLSLAAERTVNWNAMFAINMDAATMKQIERQIAMSDYARERGGRVIGLTVPVSGGAHVDMIRGCGAFDTIPGWEGFYRLSAAERVAALRDDGYRAQRKADVLAATGGNGFARILETGVRLVVEAGATDETRRLNDRSLAEIAQEKAKDPIEALFDLGVADDLRTLFTFTKVGDDADTYQKRLKLWRDERLCVGGSDAGAHVETIDTFNYFTHLLARPVRELGVLSLEECVHFITEAPAKLMGLKDRGVLAPGAWADICIFDADKVASRPVETRHDFPGGAPRLFAEADGIEKVIVRGQTLMDGGRHTGALPGQFLERGRDTATVGLQG